MDGQNFGKQFNTSDNIERTDRDTNSPVVNSDDFAEKVPVVADHIPGTPMGGTADAAAVSLDEAITLPAPANPKAELQVALLDRDTTDLLRTRWNEIQGKFVDEPRSAVQQADALVSEVIEKINQMFRNERSTLEGQWKQGNDVSTEDLRKALQHYRSFFNRLVA
jgi:hypothetical protein